MARDKQMPPVIQRHYDFLLWLMERVEKFPRSSRFVLGDRIEGTALEILELLIEAAYTRERAGLLRRANVQLEKLRYLIRIANDRRYLNLKQYEFAAGLMMDIGSQIGGWLRRGQGSGNEAT